MIKTTFKLILAFIIVASFAACSTSSSPNLPPTPKGENPPSVNIGTVGNSNSRGAVEQFLAAIRTEDLQAISLIWGTEKGPARDNMPHPEMEKREIVMICYLNHTGYRLMGETTVANNRRVVEVELTKGTLIRTTTMHVVQGPKSKWFVEKMDLASLRDFCSQ